MGNKLGFFFAFCWSDKIILPFLILYFWRILKRKLLPKEKIEAAVHRCSSKLGVPKDFQYSQETTCAGARMLKSLAL